MTALAAACDFATAKAAVCVGDLPLQPKPDYPPHGATQSRSRLSTMECAFLPTGGIVSGDCFSQLMRHGLDQPISVLARWSQSQEVR